MKAALRRCLDVVFPRHCEHSGAPVTEGYLDFLAPELMTSLGFLEGPGCRACGLPLPGVEHRPDALCEGCTELQPVWAQGKVALHYKGAVRTLVLRLKFARGLHLRRDLERLWRLAPGLVEFVEGAVLVPVPASSWRQWWRGFNQSEVMARALAEVSEATVANLLRRRVGRPPQARLTRTARRENLKRVFSLRRGAAVMDGQRYIVIDDVFTTGATLQSCTRALQQAGAKRVDVVAFARG